MLTSGSKLLAPPQYALVDQIPGVDRLYLAVGSSYLQKFLAVFESIVVAYLQGIQSEVSK